MGIFSRMGDIINSNLSALLDKAEDPQKIARLMIREMEDTLVELRTSAARSLVEQKQLKRHLSACKALINDWDNKAKLAVEKKREDLARGALTAKHRAQSRHQVLTSEYQSVEESIEQANQDMIRLQKKLEEAKAKYQALRLRYTTANDRVKMRKLLAQNQVEDALARYERIEKRIDSLEAETESYDLGYQSLENDFLDFEQNKEVEKELTALKEKTGKDKS